MQFANRNPQNHPTQGNSYHPQTSICRATHAWIYCVFSGSKKAGSRFAYTDRNLHRQNGVFMAISLSLDQKEKAKHGEQLFPLQRYITNLSSTYPAVTAHWHKEAEFTMITDGNCTYQIQLCPTLSMQEILYLCLPWFFIPSIPIPILQ
jgi:transcriptional regulator containing an amidase domain and an araC-type DNA-binding HTH domain